MRRKRSADKPEEVRAAQEAAVARVSQRLSAKRSASSLLSTPEDLLESGSYSDAILNSLSSSVLMREVRAYKVLWLMTAIIFDTNTFAANKVCHVFRPSAM